MNNRAGFSLLETMVYLCIASLLVTVMVRLLVVQQTSYDQHEAHLATLMILHSCVDACARDLARGQSSRALITINNEYCWSTPTGDVSWKLKKGALIRTQGSYNASNNSWRTKSATTVARVDNFSITQQGERVKISCSVSGKRNCCVERVV